MFEYFPGNYSHSQAVNFALRSGLQMGEIERAVGLLARIGRPPNEAEWYAAWRRFAEHEMDYAADEEAAGYRMASGERYLRAAVGLYLAQLRISDRAERGRCLDEHWATFRKGAELSRFGYEYVEVDSADGPLLGWWMPGSVPGPAPAVIFYPGFDLDKEMIVLTLRDCLRRRGIGVLVLDGPGIGESLWVAKSIGRPDYEVPTRAAMEYLRGRADVADQPIGVAGISLGGYYATRAAAFLPEMACCVSWGSLRNFADVMRTRRRLRPAAALSDLEDQLKAVMGTEDLDAALKRAAELDLTGQLDGLTQPFLVMHGEVDTINPLIDAKWVFRQVPAADKTLRVFTAGEGGGEHCQVDEPVAARELMSDWLAVRLGTAS